MGSSNERWKRGPEHGLSIRLLKLPVHDIEPAFAAMVSLKLFGSAYKSFALTGSSSSCRTERLGNDRHYTNVLARSHVDSLDGFTICRGVLNIWIMSSSLVNVNALRRSPARNSCLLVHKVICTGRVHAATRRISAVGNICRSHVSTNY